MMQEPCLPPPSLNVHAPETWPPDVRKAIEILAQAFARVFGGDIGKTGDQKA